ncbi:SSI family serine proteinase inhibitor [Streptomyces sp. NPDC008313]|uniref:SSI family serine proteinase inhibitor n=1 Tax=Streptomyces sp. NPDC008313 TaxID=3364826 RepID=UPI0036E1749F
MTQRSPQGRPGESGPRNASRRTRPSGPDRPGPGHRLGPVCHPDHAGPADGAGHADGGRRGLWRVAGAAVAALGAVIVLPAVSPAAYAGTVSRALVPPPVRDEDAGDRLTVTVDGAGDGRDGTYVLRCHPRSGDHPRVHEACDRLDESTTWGKDPFAPVPPETLCTMQYGGPATAHVTGTWAGRPVDARFDRGDGCQMARWDALVPLLPSTRP